MEYEDQVRADGLAVSIGKLSVDSDPAWFVRYLNENQRLYGILFLKHKGDWKRARVEAGYSPGRSQASIEEGEAMYAYMTAVKATLSRKLLITAETVLARLDRLALKAEAAGEYGAAIRANKLLADSLGLLKQVETTINVNADGVQIVIGAVRPKEDDVIDASYREILEVNNIDVPALAQGGAINHGQ